MIIGPKPKKKNLYGKTAGIYVAKNLFKNNTNRLLQFFTATFKRQQQQQQQTRYPISHIVVRI